MANGSRFGTPPPGKRLVVCRFIRKNGKIIYPRNGKCFAFFVDDDEDSKKKPE